MGRKVHPIGFRLGINEEWRSNWYAEGEEYARLIKEDKDIRDLIHDEVGRAGVSRIQIERFPKRIVVEIHTAKPGVVIGRRGSTVKALKEKLEELTEVTGSNLRLDVQEIENPETDAHVVAENVADQIERRVSFRRAMRRAVSTAMRAGAEGAKVACKGRLGGTEMSRREWTHEGRVPLHTLRAEIDFAREEAVTAFGHIGIKVWIYHGDILPTLEEESATA